MEAAMWAYESVFYQIYPLGFSGAPFENDGVLNHRILKVNDWIPHIKNMLYNIFIIQVKLYYLLLTITMSQELQAY